MAYKSQKTLTENNPTPYKQNRTQACHTHGSWLGSILCFWKFIIIFLF